MYSIFLNWTSNKYLLILHHEKCWHGISVVEAFEDLYSSCLISLTKIRKYIVLHQMKYLFMGWWMETDYA